MQPTTQVAARPAVRPRSARRSGGLDRWRIGIAGAVLLGVIVVVAAVLTGGGSRATYTCAQVLTPGASGVDGEPVVNMGRLHVATGARLDFLVCPPASGPHYSAAGVAPARAGVYGPDSDIGPGAWIHNLEHGYVVALYGCRDGCPSEAEMAELRRFVNGGPQTASAASCGVRTKLLAARFDDLSTRFALLAWDRVLLLDAFQADPALDFARRWIEVGAPEPGSC